MKEDTKRYRALLQKRSDLEASKNERIEQLEALLGNGDEDLTDEERATFDGLRSEIAQVDDQLASVNADLEREVAARDLRRQRVASSVGPQEPVSITGLHDRPGRR